MQEQQAIEVAYVFALGTETGGSRRITKASTHVEFRRLIIDGAARS